MFDELNKKYGRFEELRRLIATPEVVANRELYQKYAKELARLTGIAEKYGEYRRIEDEMRHAEQVLGEKHEEDFLALAREELAACRARLEKLKLEMENDLIGKEPNADKDIIMEIRAGTGGIEAALFAVDLFRMYSKYASRQGWKLELLSTSFSEKSGFKEVVFSVSGRGVYGYMKYESGTHRVQRIPETEASGRIHTSAVTVAVLPEAEEIEIDVKPEDLKIDTYRASGAGGQHVNKTDSAVRITHMPTGMVVQCQNERSQYKNREMGMKILRARLLDKYRSEQQAKISQDRRKQVGTGDRSEKIRTYNFPDRRVTDHRIGLTLHDLPGILEGKLDELIAALKTEERRIKLGGNK